MSLKYEPASEPLHISVKYLALLVEEGGQLDVDLAERLGAPHFVLDHAPVPL